LPDPAATSFGRTRTHVDEARAAAEFRRVRWMAQAEELDRLRRGIEPECIELPAILTADLEPADIVELASAVPR
jgi:hypothetical protein